MRRQGTYFFTGCPSCYTGDGNKTFTAVLNKFFKSHCRRKITAKGKTLNILGGLKKVCIYWERNFLKNVMDNYQSLLYNLTKAKENNWIILLHRGVSKKFAFEKVSLDIKYNTIEQFAEKLFFFGEKSKYFWNNKINPANSQLQFDINDTSDSFFKYIFKEFILS
jgi:hypothetical protein